MGVVSGGGGGGGAAFNGGTITTPLVIACTDPDATALTINLPAGAGDEDVPQLIMNDENAQRLLEVDADGSLIVEASNWGGAVAFSLGSDRVFGVSTDGDALRLGSTDAGATKQAGFFGVAPVAQPAAPVTLADVIAALQALGLVAT